MNFNGFLFFFLWIIFSFFSCFIFIKDFQKGFKLIFLVIKIEKNLRMMCFLKHFKWQIQWKFLLSILNNFSAIFRHKVIHKVTQSNSHSFISLFNFFSCFYHSLYNPKTVVLKLFWLAAQKITEIWPRHSTFWNLCDYGTS